MRPYIVACLIFLLLFMIFIFGINGDYQKGHLLITYETGLFVFIGLFLGVVIITARIYECSFPTYDYFTEDVKPSLINICLWTTFWISWAVFNMVYLFSGKHSPGFLIPVLLINLPGILMFLFTWYTRKSELMGIDLELWKEDTIFKEYTGELRSLGFRYHSGFYGLITIPLFLTGWLIHFIMTRS